MKREKEMYAGGDQRGEGGRQKSGVRWMHFSDTHTHTCTTRCSPLSVLTPTSPPYAPRPSSCSLLPILFPYFPLSPPVPTPPSSLLVSFHSPSYHFVLNQGVRYLFIVLFWWCPFVRKSERLSRKCASP